MQKKLKKEEHRKGLSNIIRIHGIVSAEKLIPKGLLEKCSCEKSKCTATKPK